MMCSMTCSMTRSNNIRAAALTIALTTLMTLAGCGAHQVVLNVDVLSFTPSLQQPFTGVPDVPPFTPAITGTRTVVDKQQINLLSGLGDATTIHDVSFRVQTVANASGGSGSAKLRVYLSDTNTDPLTTTPILTQQLTFTAGTPDTVTSTIGGNAQLNALFAKKQLQLSIDGTFVGPTSGAALSGASLKFVRLDAVVIAGRKL